jgi:hypothetical protein
MNKINLHKLLGWVVIAVILVGMFAFAFPVSVVSAAPLIQEGIPPEVDSQGLGRKPKKEILERIYQRELRLLDHLTADLDRVDRIIERVENLIEKLQEQGIDTSNIEAALTEFIQEANRAAELRNDAASILDEHPGFNPQGKVTNIQEAAETVRLVGEKLRLGHRTFHVPLRKLRVVIQETIEPHRPIRPVSDQEPAQP